MVTRYYIAPLRLIEQVFCFYHTQEVQTEPGFVEIDRELISHIDYEREVEKLGDIELII